MDNRRFFAYLLLGISIFLLFNSFQRQRELAAIQAKADADRLEKEREDREKKLAEIRAQAEQNPDWTPPAEPDRSRFVLGSMAAEDGYSLVVCLDNRGAGIERIEVVQRNPDGSLKYRSLQEKERQGYAGYLALENGTDGLTVRSVPPGSPASLAKNRSDANLIGLKPGDRIVGWSGLDGEVTRSKFDQWSDKWRPGQNIELTIEREGAEKGTYQLTLSEKPLDIVRAEDDWAKEQVPGNDPVRSCLMTLSKLDGLELGEGESVILGLEKTLQGNWNAKPIEVENGQGVEFTLDLTPYLKVLKSDAQIELVKQYKLHKPKSEEAATSPDHWQFHIEYTSLVRNLGEKEHKIAVRQEGVNGISLEGWWYPTKISPFFFSAAGARDVIVGDQAVSHTLTTTRSIVAHAIATPTSPDMELFGPANSEAKRSLKYIGLDTQSFTSALIASPEQPDSLKALERGRAMVLNSAYRDTTKLVSYKQQAANIGFWVETPSITLAPKGEISRGYYIFAGPKDPELLGAYKLDEALEYGWHIFGFFAKRLGWILHGFYYLVGNFGIAIMMLTVLVRSCMFPVSRKMALNAQKMQSVQPHTAKLREAFKEDPRKMMAAQQLLMKKAGVNQFAGCLPALIQLPIVIGLYRCVSVDVGLRQQALIPGLDWCSNLAGPDMLVEWHSWMPDFIAGRGTGYFGPYFNILPIITITLFIIQQKVLMPKATDEQTAIAQKMMMFMTVFMGVLFFRVPAGLCIYFITSSTWSLVERWLIRRNTPKGTNIELPENTAAEIIQTINKAGTGAPAPRTTSTNSDKPKEKYQKPPETLADLFPGWFGKKDSSGGNGTVGNGDSKKPSGGSPGASRRPKNNKPR